MEKIKVTICGRDFNLVTDDAPELIFGIAEKLEAKIAELGQHKVRSDEELITLVALNVLCEAEKDMLAVKNVIGEMHKKITTLENENESLKGSVQLTLTENLQSATRELEQIARVRDEDNEQLRKKLSALELNTEQLVREREYQIKRLTDSFDSAYKEMENIANNKDSENNSLRNKIFEYEQHIDSLVKSREQEIKNLHDGFESAVKEVNLIKENENNNLKNTLSTYETTFDNYVKLKEEEIVKLRKNLEEIQLEYAAFKSKHTEGNNGGGQLNLYS
ncbi:MAG: hypothetical protein FWG70_00805 [Oscillospiraceae bacterium]|nr:hypothetical protein [Oscillospiraceae bacterium]